MPDKYLEKARKLRSRGQLERAWSTLDEALRAGVFELQHYQELIGVSFAIGNWLEALSTVKSALQHYSLSELMTEENASAFVAMVRDSAGFRTGLVEFFIQNQSFENALSWVQLSSDGDRRWLADLWEAAAREALDTPRQAFFWIGSGLAWAELEVWERAWPHFEKGIANDPRFLRKLVSYCQKSALLDQKALPNRIHIVQLVLAAGKTGEALTLLLAIGKENKENARALIKQIPKLERLGSSDDVHLLLFNLAMIVNDPDQLKEVVDGFSKLSENALFTLKKLAVLGIKNPELRRYVLLKFGQIYLNRNNWESAALLLEGLFNEEPHPEIVAQIEILLGHYAFLPQLHFNVSKYFLDQGDIDKALHYFHLIQSVEEYRGRIRYLLEDHLFKGFHAGCAQMLLDLLPVGSHRAGLVAFWLVQHLETEAAVLAKDFHSRKTPEKPSPFWLLALLHADCEAGHYSQAYAQMRRLLTVAPYLGPEAVASAEMICNKYRINYGEFITWLDSHTDQLKPKRAWELLKKHFEEATRRFEAKQAKKVAARPNPMPDVAMSLPRVEPESETVEATSRRFSSQEPQAIQSEPGFDDSFQALTNSEEMVDPEFVKLKSQFEQFARQGKHQAAIGLLREVSETQPLFTDAVIDLLRQMQKAQPKEATWVVAHLHVLLHNRRFEDVVQMGQAAIQEPFYQAHLPELYQCLAGAFEGLGKKGEALRFYCLASRQPTLYTANREKLRELVFPDQVQLLKEVLNLVLTHEDQTNWEALMRTWYELRPQELEILLKAQTAFTDHVNSPKSLLNLAFWQLQSGKPEEVHQTLNRLDLNDSGIREALVQIASLVNLKFPEDPTPQFLLGRYYLAQREVPRAVDTFRNLASQVPDAAETIYQYLRTYLKRQPESGDIVKLYGLLIRIALDYGFTLAAVKLLDEFGQRDQAGAESLAEGVFRVMLKKGDKNLESFYGFADLLRRWRAYGRMLMVHEAAEFGTHMVAERVEWLKEAAEMPELHDQALLALAKLYFEVQEFENCPSLLEQIKAPEVSLEALSLFERLCARFPDWLELWRNAGWACCFESFQRAAPYFQKLLEQGSSTKEQRIEAHAVLAECGRPGDFQALLKACGGDEDEILASLRQVYAKLRGLEVTRWRQGRSSIPVRALEWFIENGELAQASALLEEAAELGADERALLEHQLLIAQGDWVRAAWRVASGDFSLEFKQSAFGQAGLLSYAVLLKEPGSRLPNHLRQAFLAHRTAPHAIMAQYQHILGLKQRVGEGKDDAT